MPNTTNSSIGDTPSGWSEWSNCCIPHSAFGFIWSMDYSAGIINQNISLFFSWQRRRRSRKPWRRERLGECFQMFNWTLTVVLHAGEARKAASSMLTRNMHGVSLKEQRCCWLLSVWVECSTILTKPLLSASGLVNCTKEMKSIQQCSNASW